MTTEHPIPSWRTRVVLRILCLIATLVAEDEATQKELRALANHLGAGY